MDIVTGIDKAHGLPDYVRPHGVKSTLQESLVISLVSHLASDVIIYLA